MSQAREFEALQHLWPNFSKSEIDCNCEQCGHELWDQKYGASMPEYLINALVRLQALREEWGKAMVMNSAHRCVSHNANVRGKSRSKHLDIAFDVRIPWNEQEEFKRLALEHGFNGIGLYPNDGFVHIDDLREYLTQWNG